MENKNNRKNKYNQKLVLLKIYNHLMNMIKGRRGGNTRIEQIERNRCTKMKMIIKKVLELTPL